MTWLQRYHRRQIIKSSLWLVPLAGMLAAILVAPTVRWLDWQTRWSWFNYSAEGARAILEAFASSMLTFFIFVLSSMVIVVQLASAQLTPRIINFALSKRQVKITLGVFTFSYVYTLAVLGRVE